MATESTAEVLAREFAALNTATERAHAALADLRSERSLLADERRAAEAVRAEVRSLINDQCSEAIGECVRAQLAQFEPAVKAEMDRSVTKVRASFDRLESLYLGLADNQIPIEDLFVERVAREVVAITKNNRHPRLIRGGG
jgi:hypothetical protein